MNISVCMATYNGERYIQEQLESILCQLGEEDEIIISDDSSSDGTMDIVKSFSDNRISLYEKNTFFNPIFNFENAIKKAKGDIIVLSDQDDIWIKGRLDFIRKKFEENKGENYTLLTDGYITDDSGQILYDSIFELKRSGAGILKNIYNNTYMGCCMSFSRGLMGIVLPFPKNIPMHDMWLGILGEMFGKVEFLTEKTIKYRRHGDNITPMGVKLDVLRQIERRLILFVQILLRRVKAKADLKGK